MSSKGLAQQDVAPTDPRTSVRKEVTSFLRHGLWRCFLLKRYEDYPAGFQSEFADTDKNKYLHYGNIHAYETKTSLAIDRMTSPRTFWGLVASATTIFGIGVWEAYLLTKGKSFHIPFFCDTQGTKCLVRSYGPQNRQRQFYRPWENGAKIF